MTSTTTAWGSIASLARIRHADRDASQTRPGKPGRFTEVLTEVASRVKATWARLIRKVYEADPLECPKCKGPMRVIALIEDPIVVRAILKHLGRWQPEALERAPPVPPDAWPAHASLPLTYHPVPDIA